MGSAICLRVRLGGLIAGILIATHCGSSATSSARSVLSIAGSWTGSMTDATVGPSTAGLMISQSGTSLSGSWTLTYPDPGLNRLLSQIGDSSGTLTGSINGMSVSRTLVPQRAQACQYVVTSTANGASLSGTWTYNTGCLSPDSGNLSLAKQ